MPRGKSRIDRLTLQDLLRMTPTPYRTRARRGCRPVRQSYDLTTREGFGAFKRRGKDVTYANELKLVSVCTAKRHVSYIRFYGPPDMKTPVWVWCDCEFFKYTLEVALARVNTSSISSSNGKAPTVRNPQMLTYLCKHLMMAAEIALRQKDLVRQKFDRDQDVEEIPKGRVLPKNEVGQEDEGGVAESPTTPETGGQGEADGEGEGEDET